LAAKVKFVNRHKPVEAPASQNANRIGKQHRPFGEPVAFLKDTPKFEAVPVAVPEGDLVLSLGDIAPGATESVTKARQMVFHCVGDTGGVSDGSVVQDAVAKAMETQIVNPGESGSPAFFYHLGDVVYFNGMSVHYPEQFFEPYQYYPAEIFAIPGNHDGDTHRRKPTDELDTEPSLYGFMTNFCDSERRPASPYKQTMTQPYVYWTLDTPLATIVGLYSNIDGSLDEKDKGPQEQWLTAQLKAAGKNCLIVAVHHAPYSLDTTHGGYPKILESLDNAIAASGRVPDMVLSGHVHNYQRFSRKINGREIPYIVAGAGGYAHNAKAMHQIQTDNGRPITGTFQTTHKDVQLMKFNQSDPGFLRISVNASSLTAEYHAVPFDGNADSNPFDSVTVPLQR
jgi:hypothetical protein